MSLDLTPIVQPILAATGLAITAIMGVYVPKAIAAFQTRTHIQLTDQQIASVKGAVQTAAGIIETELDKGAMQAAHVNIGNDKVLAQAQAVINAVPTAAAALGMTQDSVVRMIVGAVDTGSHGDPAPANVPTLVAVPTIPPAPRAVT